MLSRSPISIAVVSVLLLACGGGKSAPQVAAPEKQHAHPALPAGVEAFHDLLSPIWHAEPGAVRIARACDQATALGDRATALVTDPAPAEASDKIEVWKLATAALVSDVGALTTACGAAGRPDVEARLTDVHERFHKVAATVAEMGDHGDERPAGGTGQHGGPGEH
jgi:hypothetical protein